MKNKLLFRSILTFTLLWSSLIISQFASAQTNVATDKTFDESNPLLVQANLDQSHWSPGQSGKLQLKLQLPKGYRAYEDKFKLVILKPDGFKNSEIKISPIHEWDDKFLKKRKRGMIENATAEILIEAPHYFNVDSKNFIFEVSYQACSDQFCLFPTTKEVSLPIKLIGDFSSQNNSQDISQNKPANSKTEIKTPTEQSTTNPPFLSSENFSNWLNKGLFSSLVFVFVAGVLTSFTPCIFPMIPITLAVIGHNSEKRSRLQNFTFSLIYVLGIATTYSAMGVIVALSGGVFGANLGNVWFLIFICSLMLLMSLSMYGLFEIQVPSFLRKRFGNKKTEANLRGSYISGLIAGLVASPCVGPVLVGILTYVSISKNVFLGFILLFTYALGLGLIFLILGVYTELVKKLPRSGPWMESFKFGLGTLMLGAFYYYLNLLIPARWHDIALGLGLVILGSTFGAFIKPHKAIQNIQKGLMQALLFIGFAYMTIGALDLRPFIDRKLMGTASLNQSSAIQWVPYSQQNLEAALQSGRPVVIDFWAEWCAACHEMEEDTFTDPVIQSLAPNFTFIKYDATKDSPELQALKKQYGIQGLPTLLFFDKTGQWQTNLTLTQFEEPRAFSKRIQSLLK